MNTQSGPGSDTLAGWAGICSHKQEADDLMGVSHKEANPMTVKKMRIFNEVCVTIMNHNEGITVQRGKVKGGRARMEIQVSLTPKLRNPNSVIHIHPAPFLWKQDNIVEISQENDMNLGVVVKCNDTLNVKHRACNKALTNGRALTLPSKRLAWPTRHTSLAPHWAEHRGDTQNVY